MKRKRLFKIILILAALLFLAGCMSGCVLGYNIKEQSVDLVITAEDVVTMYKTLMQARCTDCSFDYVAGNGAVIKITK